jgi:hypothetical protein
MTEVKRNIYQRVNAVMQAVERIQKDSKPKSGPQYRYASQAAILEAVRPHLIEQGIVIIPSVMQSRNESVQVVRDSGKQASEVRTEIDLKMTFVNMDNPEDRFDACFPGIGIDSGDKGPGKALAYAFKYGLLKMFIIPLSDEPENDASNNITSQRPRQPQSKPQPAFPPIAQPLDPLRYRITDSEADRIRKAIQNCRAVVETGAGRKLDDVEFQNRSVEFAVKTYCETHNKLLGDPTKGTLKFDFFLHSIESRPQEFASKLGGYIKALNGAATEKEPANA